MDIPEGAVTKPPTVFFIHLWRLFIFGRTKISRIFQRRPGPHIRGSGLPMTIAKGLAAFLNTTLVDSYFRQFSGHTQVNAADLRSFRYPSRDMLVALGRRIGKRYPDQQELDPLVGEVMNGS